MPKAVAHMCSGNGDGMIIVWSDFMGWGSILSSYYKGKFDSSQILRHAKT